MVPNAEETKTPSGAIGAIISDLENEYERSKKFLADLYRSLEAGRVNTLQGTSDPSEDSPFVTKESDGPTLASLQDFTAINSFGAVGLTRQDSELSNCSSEFSTSIPRLPNLNPDASRIVSANNSHSGLPPNSRPQVQRRADAQRIPSASSPLRSHASGRASRKQPAVYSSCPCTEPTQDEAYDRATAAAASHSGSNALDSTAPLQRRISVGLAPYEASSPTLSHMLLPPSPPLGSHRHRRSSLDFVPAPPGYQRKWCDGSLLGCPLPPPTLTPSVGGNNAPQAGPRHHPLVKRGSLEIFGCTAFGGGGSTSCSGGHSSCSGAAPGGAPGTSAGGSFSGGVITSGGITGGGIAGGSFSGGGITCGGITGGGFSGGGFSGGSITGGGIAGGGITGGSITGGGGVGGSVTSGSITGGGGIACGGGNPHPSILSRASCSATRRLPQAASSPLPQGLVHPHAQWQPPSPSQSQYSQSQQLTHHPLSLRSQQEQLQQQSLSVPIQALQLDSHGATASGGSPPLGALTPARSLRVTESGQGPPSAGSPGHLPQVLQTTLSNNLPLSLSLSLTSPGGGGGCGGGGGGGGGGGSLGCSPLATELRLVSLNGVQPTCGSPQDPPSGPGDVRPRSGRFSRCGPAAAPAAAAIAATSSAAAAASPTAPPATAAAAAAAAPLGHDFSSSDRRALGSGEVQERFAPRTALTAFISGPGGDGGDGRSGGGGGSPFSARGIRPDVTSPSAPRRRVSLPGDGASAAAAGAAAAAPEPLPDEHVPKGAFGAAATLATAAAAAASPAGLPWQIGVPQTFQHSQDHSYHSQRNGSLYQPHHPHQQQLLLQPHSPPSAATSPLVGGLRGESRARLGASGRSVA